jgi:spermidine synthase
VADLRIENANANRSLVPMVLLLFSGFTGLVYEFCFGKRLGITLGNSGEAHSIVLATFMGGLALGAAIFGKAADNAKRPLMLYGVLELGVGLYALAFPTLLAALHSVYLSVVHDVSGFPKTVARLCCASLALLPPTVLMGGTLPAMTKHVSRTFADVRKDLSLLYATNSFGAAFGCLLSGVVMVPERGLLVTERTAAGLNVLLALAAVVLGWRANVGLASSSESQPVAALPKRVVNAALVVTALTGFTSMIYELTWIRVLSSVLGGTAYAFTLILTAFIIGISLGSWWLSRRRMDDAALPQTLVWLQVGLVASVCLTMPWYERLPYWFVRVNFLLSHSIDAWPTYQTITFVLAAAVVVAPAFCLGACFPAAARLSMSSLEQAGRGLGRAYVLNTIGTVSGSLLGGLLFMPMFGLEGNIVIGVVCNAVGVLVCVRALPKEALTTRLRWVAPAVALFAASALGLSHGWAKNVAKSWRARERTVIPQNMAQYRQRRDIAEVLFHQDDVFASVVVAQIEETKILRVNGKIDASSGADMDTQVFVGLIGPTLKPVKRALVIGMGSGVTAAAVLKFPEVEIDVVEISSAVLQSAEYFKEFNDDVLHNPRCHVHHEDARSFLAASKVDYDLIVSEPSNPWVAGVSELYTVDFYRLLKQRLKPDGQLIQWIHTYESNDSLVKLVFRTVRSEFAEGSTWLGPTDVVMVLSTRPHEVELDAVKERMQIPSVASAYRLVSIDSVGGLFAQQFNDAKTQLQYAGEGPLITDDHNVLEYGAPIGYFMQTMADVPDDRVSTSSEGRALKAGAMLRHALTDDDGASVYRSMRVESRQHPVLMRAVAERWLAQSPASVDAALAVASTTLRQRDFVRASEVLAPFSHLVQSNAPLLRNLLESCFRGRGSNDSIFREQRYECSGLRDRVWSNNLKSQDIIDVLVESQLKFPNRAYESGASAR